MFNFFKMSTVKNDEDVVGKIKDILFPRLKLVEESNPDGTPFKYHVDFSVDSNLEAALQDLQSGYNDETTRRTISRAIDKICEIRLLLNAYAEFEDGATYVVVASNDLEDLGDIIAADTD